MIAAVLTGYPQVMLAVGQPKTLLRFNIVIVLVFGAAVALTASYGLIAVSIAVLVVHVGILLGVYRFLLQPHIGLSMRGLVHELGPAVVGCLGLAAVGFPLRLLLQSVSVGPFVTIVVAGGRASSSTRPWSTSSSPPRGATCGCSPSASCLRSHESAVAVAARAAGAHRGAVAERRVVGGDGGRALRRSAAHGLPQQFS